MVLSSVASAKLNLYLHITGKRADGYHVLDSLVTFTEFGDLVQVQPDDTLTLTIDGPFAKSLSVHDNIAIKAAQALQEACEVSNAAALRIHKRIPVGAGLGGGSGDAATVLLLLNDLWRTGLAVEQLAEIGLALGADVPMCLYQQPCHISGIGEVISPANDVPELFVLLVNPNQEVLTAEVYQRFELSQEHRVADAMDDYPLPLDWLRAQRNDLQVPAMALCPVINDILVAIHRTSGCLLARMCGSGATCFGLYGTQSACEAAGRAVASVYPDWWVQSTRTVV